MTSAQAIVGDTDDRLDLLARLLDPAYYLERHPDVAKAGLDPLAHFLAAGRKERRHVHPQLEVLLGRGFASGELPNAEALLERLPPGVAEAALEDEWWSALRSFFQPELYVRQAEARGWNTADLGDPVVHFLLTGAPAGLRPSILFDHRVYRVRARQADLPSQGLLETHPFLHWLTWGRRRRIVPTALFDEAWCLAHNPDLEAYEGWAFEHYWRYGITEPIRRPSQVFDSAFYRELSPAALHPAHLLDHALNTPTTASAPGLYLRSPVAPDLADDTPLEALARRILAVETELADSPSLREAIARAEAIEPLIRQPTGPRRINLPPLRHDQNLVRAASEAVIAAFGGRAPDLVLLIPHCRVGGAARVAGAFHAALRQAGPEAAIAVVTTESDEFQRPDWFDGAWIVDVSRPLQRFRDETRRLALVNALRAFGCKTLVTVNSRLGWDVIETYGSQLATEMRLAAYLFTWDQNVEGAKVGYPIGPFQAGFDHLDLVLTDNEALRRELIERYRMPERLAARLHAVYSPVEPVEIDLSGETPASSTGPRVIWAGRFDRQKRFDIVVELARAWPELQVWAWGKSVMGDFAFDPQTLPPNIELRGEFEAFDEMPLRDADLLLYTSQWDGLPTLLIDAGLRGMTVVASRVGGVGELIDETTGWPVDAATDPAALRMAVEAALADPAESARRAAALRARTRAMTAPERYAERIAALFPELAS